MKRILIVLVLSILLAIFLIGCKKQSSLQIHDCEVTGSVVRLEGANSTRLIYKYRDLVTGEVGEMNAIHSPLNVGDHFEREVWVPRVRSERE